MIKKIFENILLQAINTIIPLIIMSIYVKNLGVQNFGKIGIALAIIQILQLFVEYGFTMTAARCVAQGNGETAISSELFANIITIKISILILGILGLNTLLYFVEMNSTQYKLVQIGYLIVLGQALTLTWLHSGLHQSKMLLIITLVPKLIVLPIVLVSITQQSDVLLAMFLNAMTYMATGVMSIYISIRQGWIIFECPKFHKIKAELKNGWPLFVSSISTSVTTSSTPIILNVLAGSQAVGLYLIADKIKIGVQSALHPVSLVMYPHISSELVNSKLVAIYKIKILSMTMLLALIPLLFAIDYFKLPILTALFGSEALGSSLTLRWMLIATFFTFCNSIMSTYILIPLKREVVYSKIYLLTALVYMLILVPLVMVIGHVGAAVAIMIAEFLLTLVLLFELKNRDFNFCKTEINSSILLGICRATKLDEK